MIEKNNPFLKQRLSNFFCLTRWSLFRTLSRKKSCHCCAWNTLPKYRKYYHRSSRKFPTSTQVLNRRWEYLRDKNTPISSTNHRSTTIHYTVRTAPHTSRQNAGNNPTRSIQQDPKDPTETQPEGQPPTPPFLKFDLFLLGTNFPAPDLRSNPEYSDPTTHDDVDPSPPYTSATPIGSEALDLIGSGAPPETTPQCFQELRVWMEVTQHSCQLRSQRSKITSSSVTNAKHETLSFSVDRDGSTRSKVFTASVSTFCNDNFIRIRLAFFFFFFSFHFLYNQTDAKNFIDDSVQYRQKRKRKCTYDRITLNWAFESTKKSIKIKLYIICC